MIDLGIAPDRIEAIAGAVRRAREVGADILVTAGGASVGDHDLVQQSLRRRRPRPLLLEGRRCAPAGR